MGGWVTASRQAWVNLVFRGGGGAGAEPRGGARGGGSLPAMLKHQQAAHVAAIPRTIQIFQNFQNFDAAIPRTIQKFQNSHRIGTY